eukprot:2035043-Prymnesium_polylepis.1
MVPARAAGVSVQWKWNNLTSVSQIASCRTLCLLPMLGGSLSISSSRCAQRAADRLPQSRQFGERARSEVVCARGRAERGHDAPVCSDVAPG